jgi:hypothetical protein
MNISINLWQVLGMTYVLGAIHHFYSVASLCLAGLKEKADEIGDKQAYACLVVILTVAFTSALWPLTAAVAIKRSMKEGSDGNP